MRRRICPNIGGDARGRATFRVTSGVRVAEVFRGLRPQTALRRVTAVTRTDLHFPVEIPVFIGENPPRMLSPLLPRRKLISAHKSGFYALPTLPVCLLHTPLCQACAPLLIVANEFLCSDSI